MRRRSLRRSSSLAFVAMLQCTGGGRKKMQRRQNRSFAVPVMRAGPALHQPRQANRNSQRQARQTRALAGLGVMALAHMGSAQPPFHAAPSNKEATHRKRSALPASRAQVDRALGVSHHTATPTGDDVYASERPHKKPRGVARGAGAAGAGADGAESRPRPIRAEDARLRASDSEQQGRRRPADQGIPSTAAVKARRADGTAVGHPDRQNAGTADKRPQARGSEPSPTPTVAVSSRPTARNARRLPRVLARQHERQQRHRSAAPRSPLTKHSVDSLIARAVVSPGRALATTALPQHAFVALINPGPGHAVLGHDFHY